MKSAICKIVGKTIAAVVVKEADRAPQTQVFLVFDDDTYFEIYSIEGDINCAGGVDIGGLEVVRSLGTRHRIVIEQSLEDKA
jgi:hypothetical protein